MAMTKIKDFDSAFPMPRSTLFFRRAWFDPTFLCVLGVAIFLGYILIDTSRDRWLEAKIGYSATRLGIILSVVMFIWGNVQGLRKQIVIYIDDDVTPNYNDALWTFGIFLGSPAIAMSVWLLLSLGSWLLFPAKFEPPRYDDACIYLMYLLWVVGAIWIYARLYAYNRNALTTTAAFITKLAWCFLGIAFLRQAERDLDNESGEGAYTVASNFIMHMVLFFMALIIIGKLTYSGPSLRR